MVSRDYRKEIGAESDTKMLSKPVAYSVILLALLGAFFAVRTLASAKAQHQAPAAAPAAHAGGH